MTDYNRTSAASQPVFLDAEVCEMISDFIADSRHKTYYSATCLTGESCRIQVNKSYTEDVPGGDQETFHIMVWGPEDENGDASTWVDATILEKDIQILLSLKNQYEIIGARRKILDNEDTILAREERDLEQHITACVMALCAGAGE